MRIEIRLSDDDLRTLLRLFDVIDDLSEDERRLRGLIETILDPVPPIPLPERLAQAYPAMVRRSQGLRPEELPAEVREYWAWYGEVETMLRSGEVEDWGAEM